MVPPFTFLVIAVTSASVAPLSARAFNPREFQNHAAERSGYLVATRSGVSRMFSGTALSNAD